MTKAVPGFDLGISLFQAVLGDVEGGRQLAPGDNVQLRSAGAPMTLLAVSAGAARCLLNGKEYDIPIALLQKMVPGIDPLGQRRRRSLEQARRR